MFERILVPLDGSELSARILPIVKRVLDRRSALTDDDSEVELLRVVTGSELYGDARDGTDPVATERRELAERARRDFDPASRVRGEVLRGDPTEEILGEAARIRATLIAMTTHGRSGRERSVRGSVAERVMRHARCPVLLANPWSLAARPLPFQRILVPLDGSELAARALEPAGALARLFGSELVLFHAYGWPNGGAPTERSARELLDAAAKSLDGVAVSCVARSGDAPGAILAAAREGFDLVAMSTHGRSDLPRWAYGSVAEHVLRECRAPLLLLPARSRGEARAEPALARSEPIRVSDR